MGGISGDGVGVGFLNTVSRGGKGGGGGGGVAVIGGGCWWWWSW